jgi:hypothetical protein
MFYLKYKDIFPPTNNSYEQMFVHALTYITVNKEIFIFNGFLWLLNNTIGIAQL